jgi:quercetin 2,3-dioxygenase
MSGVLVRRAGERFHSMDGAVQAWHCMSYGRYYDADNTAFGVLVACNEFTLAPGAGFAEHGHAEMEIVSWVLAGALRHEDSTGHLSVLRPGTAQWLGAGTGVQHSETNPYDRPARFVQMWVVPDRPALPPSYGLADLSAALDTGELTVVASARPRDDAPLRLRQAAARLHAAVLAPGRGVMVPAAPYVQVYVARGGVELAGCGALSEGDEARLSGCAGMQVTATEDPAEVLVWEMHDRI